MRLNRFSMLAAVVVLLSCNTLAAEPIKVIIDTDIAEDIDDILVTAYAVAAPEFEVLAVTTVAGNVPARSRVARMVTKTFGQPGIPVAEGYSRHVPLPDTLYTGLSGGVRYGEVAPDEAGLPAPSRLKADELIADIANRYPGEVTLVTIGSMTNVAHLLVKYPEAALNLKQIVTNGGHFRDMADQSIGWNLRYDPMAPLLAQRSRVPWVLLSETTSGPASPREQDVELLRRTGLPTTELLVSAIDWWKTNKPDATPLPHVSDLNVFAYLLGLIEVRRGNLLLDLGPSGKLPEFRVEPDPKGAIMFGNTLPRDMAESLRTRFFEVLTGSR